MVQPKIERDPYASLDKVLAIAAFAVQCKDGITDRSEVTSCCFRPSATAASCVSLNTLTHKMHARLRSMRSN